MSAVVRVAGVGAMFSSFVRRDLIAALSYRLPFMLDLFSSVVQLLMFFFIGEIVDQGDLAGGLGTSSGYFPFVVIGLALTRIIDTALRSFSTKLRSEQTTGTFEALIATPAPLATLVLGSAAYNLLYGLLSGGVTLAIAAAMGVRYEVSPNSAVGAVLGLAASMAFFAAIGVAVAAFIVVYKQGQAVLGMATSVLGLLGGAFFPVELLPGAAQVVARVNPLTWSLEVMRAALLDGRILWAELAMLSCAAGVLLPGALWLLRIAVDRARREGTLAQY